MSQYGDRFNYSAPVTALAQYEDSKRTSYLADTWSDFVTLFDLTHEHVPELLKMAHDLEGFWQLPEDLHDLNDDAPLYAIKALGQLGASEAIDPLLDLLLRNATEEWESDFIYENIPSALGLMGEAALEPVFSFINNRENPLGARAHLTAMPPYVSEANPALRERVVTLLHAQLAKFQDEDPWINADLVLELVKLKAVDSAELIEAAFSAECVDEMVMGDWEDVQIELGLLDKRITPSQRERRMAEIQAKEDAENARILQSQAVRAKKQFRQQLSKKNKSKSAKAKRKKKRKR